MRPPTGGTVTVVRSRSPWWLWPHLFSLDAPLVALIWQDWWHRAGATPLPAYERVILGLSVWMIYLADRVADTARDLPTDPETARHAFAKIWRGPLIMVTGLIGASLVVLVPCVLRAGQFWAGMLLLAAAGIYFWLVHRHDSRSWMARLPKEATVGGMFALGTAFFGLCHPAVPAWNFVVATAFFGIVCFLNCALISAWERNACDLRDPYSFLNAFPRLAAHGLRPMCWGLAMVAGGVGLAMHAWVFLPVALAAFLLGILDRWKPRITPDALRTLADTVLLTPWMCCAAFASTSDIFH